MRAKVFIDAGHGGKDPGAVDGANSKEKDTIASQEKDINLKYARTLGAVLKGCGVQVKQSREGDTYPSINARPSQAKQWGADAFISIHMNSASSKSAKGMEVLYRDAEDAKLAKAIYTPLSAITPWTDRGVKMREDLGVLNGAGRMPAALVEVDFISNYEAERLLHTKSYRESTMEATAKGICAYLGVKYVSAEKAPEEKPDPSKPTVKPKPLYTLKRLLRRNSRGVAVVTLQKRLNTLKYRDQYGKALTADGIFGARTEAAVLRFQRAKKLKTDGVVGKNSAKALGWAWKP